MSVVGEVVGVIVSRPPSALPHLRLDREASLSESIYLLLTTANLSPRPASPPSFPLIAMVGISFRKLKSSARRNAPHHPRASSRNQSTRRRRTSSARSNEASRASVRLSKLGTPSPLSRCSKSLSSCREACSRSYAMLPSTMPSRTSDTSSTSPTPGETSL